MTNKYDNKFNNKNKNNKKNNEKNNKKNKMYNQILIKNINFINNQYFQYEFILKIIIY